MKLKDIKVGEVYAIVSPSLTDAETNAFPARVVEVGVYGETRDGFTTERPSWVEVEPAGEGVGKWGESIGVDWKYRMTVYADGPAAGKPKPTFSSLTNAVRQVVRCPGTDVRELWSTYKAKADAARSEHQREQDERDARRARLEVLRRAFNDLGLDPVEYRGGLTFFPGDVERLLSACEYERTHKVEA